MSNKNGGRFAVHYTLANGEDGKVIVQAGSPSEAQAIAREKLGAVSIRKVKLDKDILA